MPTQEKLLAEAKIELEEFIRIAKADDSARGEKVNSKPQNSPKFENVRVSEKTQSVNSGHFQKHLRKKQFDSSPFRNLCASKKFSANGLTNYLTFKPGMHAASG